MGWGKCAKTWREVPVVGTGAGWTTGCAGTGWAVTGAGTPFGVGAGSDSRRIDGVGNKSDGFLLRGQVRVHD